MLRELFGFCLPLMLHTPFVQPSTFRPFDEANYRWSLRMLKALEDRYLPRWRDYGGEVIALTEDTITVRLWERIPRAFPVTLALVSDRVPFEHGPGMGYRLRDVRLGDLVDLDTVQTPNGFVCTGIGIGRRPGGVIPPGDDPDVPEFARRHHLYNKMQFIEERIPALMSDLHLWLLR